MALFSYASCGHSFADAQEVFRLANFGPQLRGDPVPSLAALPLSQDDSQWCGRFIQFSKSNMRNRLGDAMIP
jgi:hypothetical protein